jgi:hypothetical protein
MAGSPGGGGGSNTSNGNNEGRSARTCPTAGAEANKDQAVAVVKSTEEQDSEMTGRSKSGCGKVMTAGVGVDEVADSKWDK